jgi:photosystem II stability/assembly factor-like uncharacterized protein
MKTKEIANTIVHLIFLLAFYKSSLAQSFTWQVTPYSSGRVEHLVADSNGNIFTNAFYGVVRSTDNGLSWSKCRDHLANLTGDGGTRLYGGLGSCLYISTDEGDSWEQIFFAGESTWIAGGLAADTSGVIAASYEEFKRGIVQAGVFLSTDYGSTWKRDGPFELVELIAIQPGGRMFGAVMSTPFRFPDSCDDVWNVGDSLSSRTWSYGFVGDAIVLAGTIDGVYKSTNNGTTWSKAGLDSISIGSFTVNTDGEIFAAGDGGIYYSADTTRTWTLANSGLADFLGEKLVVNSNGYVFISTYNGQIYRTMQPTTPAKERHSHISATFALYQNYPNPFNPSTTIQFELPRQTWARLDIYNIIGQHIRTLVDGTKPAGRYAIVFDSAKLPSGVYFYHLQAGNFSETKKLVLAK